MPDHTHLWEEVGEALLLQPGRHVDTGRLALGPAHGFEEVCLDLRQHLWHPWGDACTQTSRCEGIAVPASHTLGHMPCACAAPPSSSPSSSDSGLPKRPTKLRWAMVMTALSPAENLQTPTGAAHTMHMHATAESTGWGRQCPAPSRTASAPVPMRPQGTRACAPYHPPQLHYLDVVLTENCNALLDVLRREVLIVNLQHTTTAGTPPHWRLHEGPNPLEQALQGECC